MKTLYIDIDGFNIIQPSDEIEVFSHKLINDYFFFIGEKIAREYADDVENLIGLVAKFEKEKESSLFTKQWEELKPYLFGENPQGVHRITLPTEYLTWLRYHTDEVCRTIYNKYYKDMSSVNLEIDIKGLYDDVMIPLVDSVCRYLDRNADKGFTHFGFDEGVIENSLVCQRIASDTNLHFSYFNVSNVKAAGNFYNGRAFLRKGDIVGFINQRGEFIKQREYKGEYKMVDLGLSVCWAECNVGASSPEDCGGRFAWGEINEKAEYDWNTYKYCGGSRESINKYSIRSGIIDNKNMLDFVDDVACVKWGNSWRIPSIDEVQELCEKCSWEWTIINGIKGCRVGGPNGNTIFLPATGYIYKTIMESCGWRGFIWTSILSDYDNYAFGFCFDISGGQLTDYSRVYGFPIRPVFNL